MARPQSYSLTSKLLTTFIALAVPVSGRAASPCQPHTIPASRQWSEPLARSITLRAGEVSLKDALSRIEAAAHLRLSYSADVLPLDRKVCAAVEASALGDVLNHVLSGIAVEPVVAGADHVVLTPTPTSTPTATSEDPLPTPVYP